MPCGGIYPIEAMGESYQDVKDTPCWMCGQSGCEVFCEEWDTGLHKKCVEEFLKTPEGKIVIAHGHEIHLDME